MRNFGVVRAYAGTMTESKLQLADRLGFQSETTRFGARIITVEDFPQLSFSSCDDVDRLPWLKDQQPNQIGSQHFRWVTLAVLVFAALAFISYWAGRISVT